MFAVSEQIIFIRVTQMIWIHMFRLWHINIIYSNQNKLKAFPVMAVMFNKEEGAGSAAEQNTMRITGEEAAVAEDSRYSPQQFQSNSILFI